MKMTPSLMARLRRTGEIRRWAVVPTIRTQTVDAHSFQVSLLSLWLAERHVLLSDGKHTAALLYTALTHEEDEAISGDIPSPYKRHLKSKGVSLSHVCEAERHAMATDLVIQTVKMADYLEALIFLLEEMAMGNGRVNEIYDDVYAGYSAAFRDWMNGNTGWRAAMGGPITAGAALEELRKQYWHETAHPGLIKL